MGAPIGDRNIGATPRTWTAHAGLLRLPERKGIGTVIVPDQVLTGSLVEALAGAHPMLT